MPSSDKLTAMIAIACVILIFVGARVRMINWSTLNWSDPTVLAAIIGGSAALGVAIAGSISGSISASYQSAAEVEKTRGTLLVNILLAYEPSQVPGRNEQNLKDRITVLIQSGIMSDNDGSICMAIVKEGCPVKVLKAP
jgi:hypothetical protein